jgi:hypothetical protein
MCGAMAFRALFTFVALFIVDLACLLLISCLVKEDTVSHQFLPSFHLSTNDINEEMFNLARVESA